MHIPHRRGGLCAHGMNRALRKAPWARKSFSPRRRSKKGGALFPGSELSTLPSTKTPFIAHFHSLKRDPRHKPVFADECRLETVLEPGFWPIRFLNSTFGVGGEMLVVAHTRTCARRPPTCQGLAGSAAGLRGFPILLFFTRPRPRSTAVNTHILEFQTATAPSSIGAIAGNSIPAQAPAKFCGKLENFVPPGSDATFRGRHAPDLGVIVRHPSPDAR